MNFLSIKKIYPIALLLAVFIFGCHSLPPYTPASIDEKTFDPRGVVWEKTTMPAELIGNWYIEGQLEFSVGEDTLRVEGFWFLIQSVGKYESHYRIIYLMGAQYYATYFLNLTKESAEVVEMTGSAGNEEGASLLTNIKSWRTLTSFNPWLATAMPEELKGNWHIQDGQMEMVIDTKTVVLDQDLWEIDSVQTNRTVDRLVLLRSGEYKSLYYREIGDLTMNALLVNGKEDIQDRNCNIPGDWSTIYRWWDFIENACWYPGSIWSYNYSFEEYFNQIDNTSAPADTIFQTNDFQGQLELQVTSSTINEGTGSLTFQVSFRIDGGSGRYFHAQKNGALNVLKDSSWTNPGLLTTEQYEVSLERDTLWLNTEEGKVYFASTKVQLYALVSVRAFVFPFTFPKEGFPDGRNMIGSITFQPPSFPSFSDLKEGHYAGYRSSDNRILFEMGKGLKNVYYRYYDVDLVSKTKPHIKLSAFTCELASFTPGH